MNNLEKLKALIGEENYNRLTYIMNLLGAQISIEPIIYKKADYSSEDALSYKIKDNKKLEDNCNYAIPLSGSEEQLSQASQNNLDALGFIEFNDCRVILTFIKDGLFYKWEKGFKYGQSESLKVAKDYRHNSQDSLFIHFHRRNEGLNSSTLDINGKHIYPTIYSYLDCVKADEGCIDYHEQRTLEDYYQFFKDMLMGRCVRYILPDCAQNPELLSKMAKVFEDPIAELVYDMEYVDQSWRFELERKKAQADFNCELDEADKKYSCFTPGAARARKWAGHRATDKRDARLDEIDKKEAEYKTQMKLRLEEDN